MSTTGTRTGKPLPVLELVHARDFKLVLYLCSTPPPHDGALGRGAAHVERHQAVVAEPFGDRWHGGYAAGRSGLDHADRVSLAVSAGATPASVIMISGLLGYSISASALERLLR